jgi:hypothetical protein
LRGLSKPNGKCHQHNRLNYAREGEGSKDIKHRYRLDLRPFLHCLSLQIISSLHVHPELRCRFEETCEPQRGVDGDGSILGNQPIYARARNVQLPYQPPPPPPPPPPPDELPPPEKPEEELETGAGIVEAMVEAIEDENPPIRSEKLLL